MRTKLSWGIFLLLTAVALITLTANTIGQSRKAERLYSMRVKQVTFFSEGNGHDYSHTGSLTRIFAEQRFTEEKIELEPWMAIPFESSILEEYLQLESWMNVPFQVHEVIEFEEWMTGDWI